MSDENKAMSAAAEDGARAERERFASVLKACDGDAAFAAVQFSAGKSAEATRLSWLEDSAAKSKAKLAESEAKSADLSKRLAEAAKGDGRGVSPIKFGGSADGDSGQEDFLDSAKALAKEKSIKLCQALSQLAREDKPLYGAYLEKMRRFRRRIDAATA